MSWEAEVEAELDKHETTITVDDVESLRKVQRFVQTMLVVTSRRVYRVAFRHGFTAALVGAIVFWVLFRG